MSDDSKQGDLDTIEAILIDQAAAFWLRAALLSPCHNIRLMLPMMRIYWRNYWSIDAAVFPKVQAHAVLVAKIARHFRLFCYYCRVTGSTNAS